MPKVSVFDGEEAEQAFRWHQDGQHIGKAVVVIPPQFGLEKLRAAPSSSPTLKLDPEGSYLLTGGLGGLGRTTARWLVERGARSLTFLSRGAQSENNTHFIRELDAMGCLVTAVSGSVERLEDVQEALARSPAPVKGVFHMAMVLEVRARVLTAYPQIDRNMVLTLRVLFL